ncbi:MAG: zinc-dependent metalloprotease [Myxococcota bacterium]
MRTRLPVIFLALAALAVGCTSGQESVTRTQTNLVPKDIFTGEWWVNQTVVEANADDSFMGPYTFFSGGAGWTDYALDGGQSGALSRIRWVIDEDFLFAYRAYEIIDGGNDDGNNPNFRGQPLAAYMIEAHVDVRSQYNGLTGEELNVVVENTSDRRWYERDFIRVDWSMNHVNSFNFLINDVTMGGGYQMESMPFDVQTRESNPDFSAAFAPQFVSVGNDPDYRFRDEWPEGTEDTIHYMSFTSVTLFSPGGSCFLIGGGPCNTFSVPMRTAFLRVPPGHRFASQRQSHDQFDRFGLFRAHQRSYIRGGVSEIACTRDADCGSNGYCRPASADDNIRYCSGLASDFGETDALNFLRPTHNIFRAGLTDQACLIDSHCGTAGSVCDSASRLCTIPMQDREIRPMAYHLNEGYPGYLVNAAYEVMGNWNEVFMRGWRAVRNLTVPDYSVGTIACQNEDPTSYCFCGSADDLGGSCQTEYNPFVTPDEWRAQGVADPYDCYIANDSFTEPSNPTSFDQYHPEGDYAAVYRYEFIGSECIFMLESNSCDLARSSAGERCEDIVDENGAPITWEQHGDLRYQFFNYIHEAGVPFGGLSEVRGDAVTGELLASDANVNSGALDGQRTRAIEWFPVLRCRNADLGCAPGEENADVQYIEGENVRQYFENVDRVEIPVAIAGSGESGIPETGGRVSPSGASRLGGLPASDAMRVGMLDQILERQPILDSISGEDAHFNVFSSRLQNLGETEFESNLLSAAETEIRAGLYHNNPLRNTVAIAESASLLDDSVADQTSPFRNLGGFIEQATDIQQMEATLSARGADFFELMDGRDFQRNRYWEYWAEAFRGRSVEEAAIRMAQLYLRAVQHHEVGHSVGLRHNFAGSTDRNNFGDGYFRITLNQDGSPGAVLPNLGDYDAPALGGDGDLFVGGSETFRYQQDLDEVREVRAERGAHNYMTSSIMDYNGDMSDSYGLGRYDQAAVLWSHFGLLEAYVGDPRIENGPTSLRGLHRRYDTETGAQIQRVLWSSYEGGEDCFVPEGGGAADADSMCPYAASNGLLADGQIIGQRCVRNPRNSRLQESCQAGDTDCLCSNFDADFDDYEQSAPWAPNVRDEDGSLAFFPVNYAFCGDERAMDISFCSRFDAGESFQEIIAHYRRSWYEGYANAYNRRFRGTRAAASFGSQMDALKIFQHLYYRLFFEPGFQSNSGPLGFPDQFQASVDAMNWLVEIVNLPDQGAYALEDGHLRRMSEDPAMPGMDANFDDGAGFQMWSEFQTGHMGFRRIEKRGVFFDKYVAIFHLTQRFAPIARIQQVETFPFNFYDLFPVPMTEFFGGMILDRPSWFAPRYDMATGTVEHLSWYRGFANLIRECGPRGATVPCRGSNEEVYPVTDERPVIDDTSNIVLRQWATILALATFPNVFDTSFEQRLIIWRDGDGSGYDLPVIFRERTTGEERPYCAYGDGTIDDRHVAAGADPTCADADDANYVTYESDRLNFRYVAEKTYTRETVNLEEEQIGFQMLRGLYDLQNEVRRLEGLGPSPELDERRRELFEGESYLEYLIDLQARFGINNAFL